MATPLVMKALRTLARRLAVIKTADGFNTSPNVYVGKRVIDESDLPAVVLYIKSEDPEPTTGDGPAGGSSYVSVKNTVSFSIDCHTAPADHPAIDSAYDCTDYQIGLLVADVKTAAFIDGAVIDTGDSGDGGDSSDTKIGALFVTSVEYQPVEDGSHSESAQIACQITLIEAFGNPYIKSKTNP